MQKNEVPLPEDAQSALNEARCARLAYDELVRRIKKFQAELQANEQMVVEVRGVLTEAIGVRGAILWFQGTVGEGRAVTVVQHYTQLNLELITVRLEKGEQPRTIGFFAENE